jgi:uncharacterized protein with FMN-binding domain
MADGGSRRISTGLAAASGAAVIAVYTAGYLRTQSAAERFKKEVADRRIASVAPRRVKSVTEGLHWKEAAPAALTAVPAGSTAAPIESPPTAVQPAHSWKDGTFSGWGFSRHGNIEATVVIEAGRIARAFISQCRTRYSCGVIGLLPPQVVERQGPDVDYVSGATESADAFYEAVAAALGKAK